MILAKNNLLNNSRFTFFYIELFLTTIYNIIECGIKKVQSIYNLGCTLN